VKYYLMIIRPFNCLFIGLAVLAGGLLNNYMVDFTAMIFAILSAIFIAAGGYVINDFYDLHIDIVNKPQRIMPRGKIAPERAYLYSLFLFVLGFSLSFFTANIWAIIIAIINSLLLYFYAKKLKRSVLVGNIVVSYTTASTFLFGAVVGNNVTNILPIFAYTLLYTLVREIVKDAEDKRGDERLQVKTLATIYGEQKAVLISLIPAVILAGLLVIGYGMRLSSVISTQTSFWVVFLLYTIPLLLIYVNLFRNITSSKLNESSTLIKLHMLVLLFVLIFIG